MTRAALDSGDLVTGAISEKGLPWESVYPSRLVTDSLLALIDRGKVVKKFPSSTDYR